MPKQEELVQLKQLIKIGKEQGYLTYAQISDSLPSEVVDPEQIESIIKMISGFGVKVVENMPDEDLWVADKKIEDESESEDFAVDLVSSAHFGLTDPLRMYMREMGSVELLTREGEIAIAQRIEGGMQQVLKAIAYHLNTIEFILKQYELITSEENNRRLSDIVIGWMDEDKPKVKKNSRPNRVEGTVDEKAVMTQPPKLNDINDKNQINDDKGKQDRDGECKNGDATDTSEKNHVKNHSSSDDSRQSIDLDMGPDPKIGQAKFAKLDQYFKTAMATKKSMDNRIK